MAINKSNYKMCGGKLKETGKSNYHSHINSILSDGGYVARKTVLTSYKCENGHEYETTGKDRRCTHR